MSYNFQAYDVLTSILILIYYIENFKIELSSFFWI